MGLSSFGTTKKGLLGGGPFLMEHPSPRSMIASPPRCMEMERSRGWYDYVAAALGRRGEWVVYVNVVSCPGSPGCELGSHIDLYNEKTTWLMPQTLCLICTGPSHAQPFSKNLPDFHKLITRCDVNTASPDGWVQPTCHLHSRRGSGGAPGA